MIEFVASEQANSIELSGPHIQQRTFPHRIFFIHNLQRATHRTSTSWQVRRRRRISEPTANHLSELLTQLAHRTLSTANFQQQRTPSDSSLENYNSSNRLNMASVSNLTATAALLLLVAVQATPVTKQHQQPVRSRRAATARQDRLWDEAVIPYEIDPLFSNERASLFRSAMRHWENHTCVRFVERQPEEHPNYIVFTERSCGCCSFVGKRGNGAQAISIGKHCDKFGIVVHELGHVVGFWHEHTRPDRDQHVQIIAKNIMSGQEYNFNKLTKDEVNSLGLAYDYDSILHYATNTFAKDTYLDTILPLHGHLNTEDAANQTQPAVASTTAHIAPTPTSNTAASTGGPELVINEPNLAKQAANNTSAPHMINDEATTNANLQQLQRDFESMLQYQPDSSHHRAAASQMVLLDGTVVVKLNNQPEPKQQQQTRQKRGSVDVEDGFHMLAMDNLLAKTRPEIGQRMRLSVGDIAQTNLLYKCPKCGRTIQQLSGTFQSPNYFTAQTPDKRTRLSSNELNPEIPPNQVVEKDFCEWRLTVGQGERIMINITDLDLASPTPAPDLITHQALLRLGMPKTELDEHELHDVIGKQTFSTNEPMIKADCVTDYIEVRDGYTYRAPVIAKLCGHISSLRDFHRPIVSTGNRLLITYKTTSLSTGKRGFSAQHETLCGGYILLGNSAVIKEPIFQPLMPMPTPIETVRVDKVPAAHATSQNKIALNGSSPSENEVLLSSQTNLRYNNLQSQQPVLVNVSTDIPANDSSTATNSAQSSAYGSDSQKSFGWGQWPAMNMSYLQSPNWPELYRPNRECIWQIKAEENHQISMRFESFDLESHGSCAYDYLEIRDGDAMNSSLIGRYCGKGIPEQILSTNHSMMVKFVSDSDVNRGGFLATFQSELDECKLGTHGCSYRCSNAVVPYRCECPSDLELAPDGKSCVRICGGIKNETTGLITSPLFPDLYPISTKCIWEIVAPSHHRITLNFTHFDLEGIKAQECDYDYVDIRSRVEGGKYVKNGVFCGPNQALVVTSVANVMRIEFNSDSSIQKSGFQATYFIDTDECDTNNGGCQHICTNTIGSYQCSCNNGFILHENKHECLEGHCLYAITSPDGVFHSPNFPSTYQPNKECAWVFTTAPGHRIKLIFDQFDLESHQECAYDHVAVYDGETENDPALGRFCGSRRPLTLISSFNTLYLLFRSDATNEKRGFNASHTTVCGGRLLQANLNQNDLIYSHPSFDGTTHYSRNEDCEWRIEANFNQRVKIEFTFFALEADNNCYYDVVSIYDGAEDTDPQLARLCGTELTKDQSRTISSGESLLIVFKTDDSINNRGFSLTYTAIESNEDDSVAVTPTMSKYSQPS